MRQLTIASFLGDQYIVSKLGLCYVPVGGVNMIQCDKCYSWQHCQCVGVASSTFKCSTLCILQRMKVKKFATRCKYEINISSGRTKISWTMIWQFHPSFATNFCKVSLFSSFTSNFWFFFSQVTSEKGHKHDLTNCIMTLNTQSFDAGPRVGTSEKMVKKRNIEYVDFGFIDRKSICTEMMSYWRVCITIDTRYTYVYWI